MMKITQFAALPMAVSAIQVDNNTIKKGLKKALGAGMMAALPSVTAQTLCNEFEVVETCSQACESRGFMQAGECWGSEGDGFCVKCLCNDGSDLSSEMPLDCTNQWCDSSACAADNTKNTTQILSKQGDEPTCYETNVICAQTCAANDLLVHRTECYGGEDSRCMVCACNDNGEVIDFSDQMPLACTSEFCGYEQQRLSNCPVEFPPIPGPTCYETNIKCAQTCAERDLLVHFTECWGEDDNRCMICACNDNGAIIDISDEMPLACTNADGCGFGDRGFGDLSNCPTEAASALKASEPSCYETNVICAQTCAADGLLVQRTECYDGADGGRCMVCACNDNGTVIDYSDQMPLACTSEVCGYEQQFLSNCPVEFPPVPPAPGATCYDTNVKCAQTCAERGLLVQRTECYGEDDNRCMVCACNDNGAIVDISNEMPLACTNADGCGYGDLSNCPTA